MFLSRGHFAACCLIFFGALAGLVAQPLNRVANNSLRVPASPALAGYVTTDAFPGLTFDRPLCIVSPPGETNRLFIVEKGGSIQVITNLLMPSKKLFLDITSRVYPGGEGGLLGLAFHPG